MTRVGGCSEHFNNRSGRLGHNDAAVQRRAVTGPVPLLPPTSWGLSQPGSHLRFYDARADHTFTSLFPLSVLGEHLICKCSSTQSSNERCLKINRLGEASPQMPTSLKKAVALQAPLCMGLSRQDFWSGLSCLPLGIFRTQRWNPCLSCIGGWIFSHYCHLGSP